MKNNVLKLYGEMWKLLMGIFIDISIYIKKGKRSNLQLNFTTDGNKKKKKKKYIKLAEGSNKNWSRYTLNGE